MSKYQWIFTKLGVCIDIVEIWFGIANGQISSFFDSYLPITARYMSVFSFPGDNLSKYQCIFTKLGMCIDIVEFWFEFADGQILLHVIYLPAKLYWRGVIVSHFYLQLTLAISNSLITNNRLSRSENLSMPEHENLTTGKKYCGKEEKLRSNFFSFPQHFQYISNFRSQITHILF